MSLYINTFNLLYNSVLYNWMPEVIDRKQVLNGTHKTTKCLNSIFYIIRTSKLIMPLKPKGSRCKYSSETISVILKLKKSGQSHYEIAHHLEIPKSFITIILD